MRKSQRMWRVRSPGAIARLFRFRKLDPPDGENADNVDRLIRNNDRLIRGISGRYYKVLEILGYGGFGTVHKARVCVEGKNLAEGNTNGRPYPKTCDLGDLEKRRFAIKTEKWEALRIEICVLEKARGRQHFCELVDLGTEPNTNISFMVMTLLGPSLSDMRHESPAKRLSFSTVIRIAMQTLGAIQEVHECGFIQRDIKPSNFAIGLSDEKKHRLIHMLDFGISKWYLDAAGNPVLPREKNGWRGTLRYCSLYNHMKLDLSRRDDIESWFYTIVELLSGELPWYSLDRNKKEEVEREKRQARTIKREQFLDCCPPEFDVILTSIDRWGFFSIPDYDGMFVYLMRAMKNALVNFEDPYDWERNPSMLTAKRKEIVKANKKEQQRLASAQVVQSVFGEQAFLQRAPLNLGESAGPRITAIPLRQDNTALPKRTVENVKVKQKPKIQASPSSSDHLVTPIAELSFSTDVTQPLDSDDNKKFRIKGFS